MENKRYSPKVSTLFFNNESKLIKYVFENYIGVRKSEIVNLCVIPSCMICDYLEDSQYSRLIITYIKKENSTIILQTLNFEVKSNSVCSHGISAAFLYIRRRSRYLKYIRYKYNFTNLMDKFEKENLLDAEDTS